MTVEDRTTRLDLVLQGSLSWPRTPERDLSRKDRVTKGPVSRAQGIAMAFKLVESAQARWRKVNAPHLVAQVRAGATFRNGELNEHDHEHTQRRRLPRYPRGCHSAASGGRPT